MAITASVEEHGIRLTVTLDRDRTVFGQRVMAEAVVENVGTDSVFWGHSSTCVHPVSIAVRPDDPTPLPFGRDDWNGDPEILKMVTVDERSAAAEPMFGFMPEEWLEAEGNFGCTSDLVVTEVPPGESLVHRPAWDTLGLHGMPPSPGMYTVDATFAFMSRGSPPGPEAVDEVAVTVSIPLTVEGPDVDYVAPGEAVDALLSDEAFQTLLADAPRELWLESDLQYVEARWELVLYLSASDGDVEAIEALVGVVDARSGVVLHVGREPRTRPAGG